jgi:hypothetical protein
MKIYFTFLLAFISVAGRSQPDTSVHARHTPYERHSVMATVSLGFADFYRQYYSLPKAFKKTNTAGFAPVYLKLEYGLKRDVSVAATMSYDAFIYNFRQDYVGNSGPFTRYRSNNARIISGGLTAFYHLGRVISSKHVDPFIGVGISINNVRYSAYPQGDSTLTRFDHTVTPYLKVGARYYISSRFGLFGDVGYDQQSIFSVGASCRFFSKKTGHSR